MSELRAYKADVTIPVYGTIADAEVYLKPEADHYMSKLIADQQLELDEWYCKVQHQKYKRCLAMAKWCRIWADYWNGCEPHDCSMFIVRARFFRRWYKRWLELTEKFKETR